MKHDSHEQTTRLAFDILKRIDGSSPLHQYRDQVVEGTSPVDGKGDLEFVDVDYGQDDPHVDTVEDEDDHPHRTAPTGDDLCTFNHVIDIKKGPGIFDDFDGYAYVKGSASLEQYQRLMDATDEKWDNLVSALIVCGGHVEAHNVSLGATAVSQLKVDDGMHLYLSDEYVHAPGQQWYRGCSPCLEWYSFFLDEGKHASVTDELLARFPSTGEQRGVPNSVFMPVDNMARYWYGVFKIMRTCGCLSYIMHAIQDASIPHHAAGYQGNWHGEYETALKESTSSWWSSFNDPTYDLVKKWLKNPSEPPKHLSVDDWKKVPGRNWRIDHLVTWVALNAYREYRDTYRGFADGYSFVETSAKVLFQITTAVCVLALIKAAEPMTLKEALSNIGRYPTVSVPRDIKPDMKTKSLRKIMEAMYVGRISE